MSHQQDMEVFVQVVKSGSFAQAAAELELNPSAVSRRISNLEERLGVLLLNRTTRKLSLTEVGDRYFTRCLSILAEIEEAEQEARQHSEKPQGLLYVSCSTLLAHRYIISRISAFLEQYPRLKVRLVLADDVVDISNEGIDVALRIGELANTSLIAKKLMSNRRIICASSKYLERYGTPKTPDDLAYHNCLTLNAHKTTLNQWRFKDKSGFREISVRGNFEVNSGEALYQAVLAGLGIGRIATFLTDQDARLGQVVHLLAEYEDDTDVGIYALFPSSRYLLPKVKVFVDFLEKSFLHLQ
jgi:DNA-binding transcriptional LysR family regulator